MSFLDIDTKEVYQYILRSKIYKETKHSKGKYAENSLNISINEIYNYAILQKVFSTYMKIGVIIYIV